MSEANNNDKMPMTVQGKAALELELKRLILEERPAVIKAIEVAREHGDISENADYDAAKERQGMIEARIGDIQGTLATAEVVDVSQIKSDRIVFGAIVTLEDLDEETKVTYQIVGLHEADVKIGKISIMSPIARALIGKKVEDVITVSSPKLEKEYKVLKFEFK